MRITNSQFQSKLGNLLRKPIEAAASIWKKTTGPIHRHLGSGNAAPVQRRNTGVIMSQPSRQNSPRVPLSWTPSKPQKANPSKQQGRPKADKNKKTQESGSPRIIRKVHSAGMEPLSKASYVQSPSGRANR